MISCTEFIPLYSEFFKYCEKRGGHDAGGGVVQPVEQAYAFHAGQFFEHGLQAFAAHPV